MGLLDGLFGTTSGEGTPTNVNEQMDEQAGFPEVEITRVDPHQNAALTDVWMEFTNQSNEQIKLESIEIFGQTVQLGGVMSGNSAHEFHIWQGEAVKDDAYDSVKLYYEDDAHLYEAEYVVEYYYDESTGRYFIKRLKRLTPIERK